MVGAIREQNRHLATGQIGQPPVPQGQPYQRTIDTLQRLHEPEQFGDIIVKSTREGENGPAQGRGQDRGGGKEPRRELEVNGRPSASLAIFMLPDATPLKPPT